MLEIVLLLVLLAGSLAGSYLALRAKAHANEHQNSVYVIALSLLSVGLATLGELTLDPDGMDSGTLLRMLKNLAIYAALPMSVTALLAVGFNKEISLPGWGRWLLGLFALFELLRRMGYGETYLWVLTVSLLLGMLIAILTIKIKPVQILLSLGWIGGSAAAFLYFANATTLIPAAATLPAVTLGLTATFIAFDRREKS